MRRLVLCSILLACASPVGAGVFSYRDEHGKVHFVDQESAIPHQYRASGQDGAPPAPDKSGGVMNAVPVGDAASSDGPADGAVAAPEAGPGGGEDSQPSSGMLSCTLRYVEKPSKEIDLRYTTVTYRGEVENGGTGIARTARAHLKLFSAVDGSQIDEESALLRPGDVDPKERATFEIKGNFRKAGLRNSSRDELMIDYVRCDPTSAEVSEAAPDASCDLKLVAKPSKEIDQIRKTLTYTGSVQNQGQKVAKTVQVELTSFNIRTGRPFPTVFVNANPSRVAPGQTADFQLVAPLEFGFRDPDKDKFTVRASRCDDPAAE